MTEITEQAKSLEESPVEIPVKATPLEETPDASVVVGSKFEDVDIGEKSPDTAETGLPNGRGTSVTPNGTEPSGQNGEAAPIVPADVVNKLESSSDSTVVPVADEETYALEDIKVTQVAAGDIDDVFRCRCIDLISAGLEGKVLAFSDQWFADAANLLTPTAPIRQPGKMVYTGAWYDGWETRRHNPDPFDWVIIRLGVASGTVEGVEVDTAFFSGNHAPAISVEGCFNLNDEDVVSWGGKRGGWETILGLQECGPTQRFGWKLDAPTTKQYTHVRLNMYPDGGIARFRLFGHAVPVFPDDKDAIFDLAATQNGAVAVSCSDQHFGTKENLLLPGRGKDMGDGWETARSRSKGHIDWAIVRLGAPGYIQHLIVDTAYFRGNFPQKVKLDAIEWTGESEPGPEAEGWVEIAEPSHCGPDKEHVLPSLLENKLVTHVKLVIIPDGGVKRLRVFGKRAS